MRQAHSLICIAVLAFPCHAAESRFEVVSFKSMDTSLPLPSGTITVGGPGSSDPGRFMATKITMGGLLNIAFGVPHDQLVAPSWVIEYPPTRFYTFNATMSPATTREQFQQMLQNALIEYAHMTMHHETQKRPGYSLTVDVGGPKLQEVKPDSTSSDAPGTSPSRPMRQGPDGFTILPPGPRLLSMGVEGGQRTKYQEWTMDKLAANLGGMIALARNGPAARVNNKAGLSGTYTFTLEFSTGPESNFPDIFTAVRKQLGLRLTKTDDVSVDVIVIDSIDKVPVEN